MARGRMLSTTIATDKDLNSLSVTAELLYLKAIPHLDRDGLIVGDSDLLFSKIAPRRPALMRRTEAAIAEWLTTSLVIRYTWKDGQVLYFHGFKKHNAGIHYEREAPSIFPPPPGYVRTETGLVPEAEIPNSVSSPNEVPPNSGPTPDEVPPKSPINGKEVKGKEEGKSQGAPSQAAIALSKARNTTTSPADLEFLDYLIDRYGDEQTAAAIVKGNAAKDRDYLSLTFVEAILEGRGKKSRRNGRQQDAPQTAEELHARYVPKGYEDSVEH